MASGVTSESVVAGSGVNCARFSATSFFHLVQQVPACQIELYGVTVM